MIYSEIEELVEKDSGYKVRDTKNRLSVITRCKLRDTGCVIENCREQRVI